MSTHQSDLDQTQLSFLRESNDSGQPFAFGFFHTSSYKTRLKLLEIHKLVEFMHSHLEMSSPTVIVVGCGIAGPVLALLLQQKGYAPVIVEKVRELGDAGGALGLMPNG